MELDIQNEHMKRRCMFISAMCGLSLYSWYNYSLFDPIDNNPYTPYYQNGLLFLFYLGWDTYHMATTAILYRTDLVIHHIFAFMLTGSSLNNCTLHMSDYMIMECISLMNYTLRNNVRVLNIYRTVCILCVRMPLTLWFILFYHPTYMFPYWEMYRTPNHYLYLYWLYKGTCFFLFYDMLILWKVYKTKTHKIIVEKCA
jgi:hypothetical protein